MSIPNYLTLLRIVLTPCFFTALVSYGPGKENLRWLALAIFIFAAITDALDGILARFLKQRTPIGELLDPLADKLLLISGYLGLIFVKALPFHPPLWVTVTIIFRDLILLFGFFVITFFSLKIEIKPNRLGKWTTVFQMLLLIFVLLELPISRAMGYLTGFLTIISGIVYVTRGLKIIQ